MKTLFLLINKYFWKGHTGPVYSFLVPPIIVFFIGLVIGPQWVMPGGLMIPVVMVSLLFLPQSIFEFKNSTLLKRIGVTKISPINFLFVILSYNVIIIFLSVIFMFLMSFAIFSIPALDGTSNLYNVVLKSGLKLGWIDMIKNVDWPSFIYSMLIYIILSASIGFFISSIARTSLFIQSLGMTIVLISFFVAPLSLPIPMVDQFSIMKYLGYLLPIKYPISLGVESFSGLGNYGEFNNPLNINNSSIWNINKDFIMINPFNQNPNDISKYNIIVFREHDKILNLIMPYLFILIFLFFGIEKFSWSNRSKKQIKWSNLSIFNFLNKKENANKNVYNNDDNNKYILKIHNVTKKFNNKGGEIIANDNISFEIKKNKNIAILGANGCGKTTLVEQIVGLSKPNSGYFEYNLKFEKSFHETIGIQFQDSTYPVGLKCSDIINFVKDIYSINIEQKELDEILDNFGVRDFYNKNASSLSGGQQQRLNLLLSIIHKPQLLFLDELSTGLDIKIRNNIKKFIKEFSIKNKITIVIVSHDMNEVEYLCEEIVLLKSGKVVEKSSISEIKRKHKNLEEYIAKNIE